MKLIKSVILITFGCLLLAQTITSKSDCEERAEKVSVNFTECCKFPEFVTKEEVEEIKKSAIKIVPDPEKDSELFSCLFMQKFFEVKKLIDSKKEIDKAACIKFVGDLVKDTGFKDLVEPTITDCFEDTKKHADNFQKDSKIPKNKCLVKYDYMADCVRLEMFEKCPKDAFTKDEKIKEDCEFTQKFVTDCNDDEKAMEIFEANQEGA